MEQSMNAPGCARCGHPAKTHAINSRAFSECHECGPCVFIPLRLVKRDGWTTAFCFVALVVAILVGGWLWG